MVSDGRVSGGEVYVVSTPTLVEEGPIWDVYSVDCPKCDKHLRFLWKHFYSERDDIALISEDVHCICGEIIQVFLPGYLGV